MRSTKTIYPLLDAARDALSKQDGMAAWRATALVLEQFPEHLEARHLSGLASYLLTFGAGAMPHVMSEYGIHSETGSLHLQVGLALQKQGQAELAVISLRTAALLDFHLKPALAVGFGGPFNGQILRQTIFRSVAATRRLGEVIETGAHRGTTTEFMARYAGCPVKTTEIAPYYLEISRLRFEDLRASGCPWAAAIELHALESREFLAQALAAPAAPGTLSFFYLDAHGEYLEGEQVENPLLGEIRLVRAQRGDAIIMIDDVELPDDPGYTVQDANTFDHLKAILPDFDARFLPIDSRHESGFRRGCLILSGSRATTALLSEIGELRPAD
jgi:hypothetical protein